MVFRGDARPVIGDRELIPFPQGPDADIDLPQGLIVVLDGIAEKVLEDLLQAKPLRVKRGQVWVQRDGNPRRRVQQINDFGQQRLDI